MFALIQTVLTGRNAVFFAKHTVKVTLVFISDGADNLIDAHVRACEQAFGGFQPLFEKERLKG